MIRSLLLLLALVPSAFAAAPSAEQQHHADIDAWFGERIARLTRPDGWLSLVGLHWLAPGEQTVGHAADNDIALATGPARLGRVRLADGEVTFTPADEAGASIDGVPVTGPTPLPSDASGHGVRVMFADGKASFEVIQRGDRLALRVRDADAPTRTGFHGIERFDVSLDWRHEARFEPHPDGQTIDIVNVLGQTEPMPNPGAIVFEHGGRSYRLETVDEGVEQLFVIFADRTSGKQTYGAGRFVYVDPPVDGHTVIDFNEAYNPPCAFTSFSTCPLPPPGNRLDLAITAGEKRYGGH